jgi:iron only hydrogenase large subunit-like protein
MDIDRPIYTEQTKCRDCYKCVRICPVKAIKVENNSAQIIHENCIFCGRCVSVCPSEAKKVRNDVPRVKALLASGRKVILSIAPSWSSGLFGTSDAMINTFKKMGFWAVSETALGAQMVSQNLAEDLTHIEKLVVSSACPTIVELFKKYYPENIDSITPYLSPLGVHTAYLKETYGDEVSVVFAGPCIAKKLEADNSETPLDFALTFDEVQDWIQSDNITVSPYGDENDSFIPFSAAESTLYALEGGMIGSIKGCDSPEDLPLIPVSGITHIIEALNGIDPNDKLFLELLACPGGCINGSGFNSNEKQFLYRKKSLEYHRVSTSHPLDKKIALTLDKEKTRFKYVADIPIFHEEFDEKAIAVAMEELGKSKKEDRLDCGGCGYNSCNDFAIAYLRGMGEKQMCVTTMRRRAQKKVDMLLRTLPMGVVIVNRQMNIAECNKEFVKLFSEIDFEPDEEFVQNYINLPIVKFIDITGYLEQILLGNRSLFQERIKYNDQFLRVSFFSIEKLNLAGVIFQDITTTSMKREVVIRKAEEVINKNLQSVQQIASLLGENAAETEIILRSLTDQFQYSTPEVD